MISAAELYILYTDEIGISLKNDYIVKDGG